MMKREPDMIDMDMLVSVDTSVLHLAGCMGVPAIGLIPNPPERRWLMDGARTTWYGCVVLVRQEVPRAWGPAIGKAAELVMLAADEMIKES